MNKTPMKASDPNDLERRILDSNIAKSEAEWWAKGRIEELERELERERIRLAACGVVTLANTPESAANAREMSPEYRSASLDGVIRAVDSEMSLRQERDALQADNARLREVMQIFADLYFKEAINALAATPDQSLARIRNQVREECAVILDNTDAELYDSEFLAATIRAMKEPE